MGIKLELQTAFPRSIRQCLDTAMVEVTTAVKNHRLDRSSFRLLCYQESHPLRLLRLGQPCGIDTGFIRVSSHQRVPGPVVDDLAIHRLIASINAEAGALRSALYRFANSMVNSPPATFFIEFHVFYFYPGKRRT